MLPARVEGYRPAMLDELCAAGELVWTGAGALGADDGRVRLFFRDHLGRTDWTCWNQIRIKRTAPIPTVLSREEVRVLGSYPAASRELPHAA